MTRVLLVDDQDLVRMGIAMLLGEADDLSVVGEAASGEDAVDRAAALRPDVVVMDVRMPGMGGLEATRQIVASGAAAAVLVLTTFDLDEYAFGALNAGASGFMLKDARPDELIGAVRTVAAGDAIVSPRLTRKMIELHRGRFPAPVADDTRLSTLTDREREVFTAIGRGRNNAEIAAELHLSLSTVKAYVGRVLAKLQLRDRVHAVILAHDLDVL